MQGLSFSEMPAQNNSLKISACLDLATHLLQVLILTKFGNLLGQKGQKFTLRLSLTLRRWFVWKYLNIASKRYKRSNYIRDVCLIRSISGNCMSRRQAGWVLAESLIPGQVQK